MRKTIAAIVMGLMALAAGTSCAEEKKVEQQGTRVRVRAPFTKVDVFVPEDDPEETEVDVDVDD